MENMLKKYMSGEDDAITITFPYYIKKDSKAGVITSAPLFKIWRTVIDKRVVNKTTGKTYPYGY